MKNFGIMILCISLAVSAFLFALNGRYQVFICQGDIPTFVRCDTITGRTWKMDMQKGLQWTEIRDYGFVYILEEQKKDKV